MALSSPGVTVTPSPPGGGDSSSVSDQPSSGVSQIFSTSGAFAALKDDGSVITWGVDIGSGDSSSVSDQLSSGVSQIFSTQYDFAALKDDGSVITWGSADTVRDSSSVSDQLSSGVSQIFSTDSAFAALKDDGSVTTWGGHARGGDSSSVSDQLSSGVSQIFSTDSAFAALKDDGSVITWSIYSGLGGDSSSVSDQLSSGVVAFADPFHDDRLIPGTSGSDLISDPSAALTITFNTGDLNGDGFVDGITNYQMWTASGGVDLTNRRGKTYSDDSSRMWDAIKAVKTNSGFSVLVEGQRNKDGKYKVVSANEEGVIGRATRWLNGNQMFNEGYEDLFAMDFNGNSEIGF